MYNNIYNIICIYIIDIYIYIIGIHAHAPLNICVSWGSLHRSSSGSQVYLTAWPPRSVARIPLRSVARPQVLCQCPTDIEL